MTSVDRRARVALGRTRTSFPRCSGRDRELRCHPDGYAGLGDVLRDQAQLLASGMFLAWIYLRTRNLWWAIGLHSLANYPVLLIAWQLGERKKVAIALLGLVSRFSGRGQPRPREVTRPRRRSRVITRPARGEA